MPRNRKSTRLKKYDYSKNGAYFVTICINDGVELFWEKGENMVSPVRLSDIGLMIEKWWIKTFEKYYNEIKIGKYVIMPNHLHGIIYIVGANPCIRPINKSNIKNEYAGVGKYVSWFKRMSTNEYIRNRRRSSWPHFDKRFWHRNFYDHIIRDEKDLMRIHEYIENNPLNWGKDEYYEVSY